MSNLIKPGHIELDIACKSCDGTGLYVGFAEGIGSAVICHTCKGSGCSHFVLDYEPFEKRKDPSCNIKRVFRTNPGIGIGGERLEIFGGMPIKDWMAGEPFPERSEDRRHTCPAWYYQSADYSKKPKWDECLGMGVFSSCDYFGTKSACWLRWDKEFGKKK
jgi:hypothetical protein